MDYRFTNEYPTSKIDEIVHYLAGPRLWIPQQDYPDFSDWAQKVHTELTTTQKRALIALSGNDVVGVTIYQQHKQRPDTLEIKNLTVRPDARGRHIASFLLRNAELEGMRDFHTTNSICDAKIHNHAIMYFLLKHHYTILGRHDLYGLRAGTDVVYTKQLTFHA
jgi:GNAT superfamily N-acetyltransferase